MDSNELRELTARREGLKLEFKREFDLDGPDKAHKRDEFTKDVLALVNTGSGLANQTAYLIIGADDELGPAGTRDLYDIGSHNLSTQKILSIVNARCDPPLSQLEFEMVNLDDKEVGVLTIPPSPHIHHIIKDLVTGPGKVYRRGVVFIRRVEGIDIATPADIEAIRVEKGRWHRLQIGHDRIRDHLAAIVASPHYARWNDAKYIYEKTKPLPMHVSVFEVETELDRLPKKELVKAVCDTERAVILGDPGSGKTTALERLMLVYASDALEGDNGSDVVPVIVPLSEYGGEESLIPLVQASLNELGVFSLTSEQTADLILNMRCAILVDGLNELPGEFRERGFSALRKLMRTYPHNKYVVTCRARDYKKQLGNIDTLVIQDLDESDVTRYLQAHLGETEGQSLYSQLSKRLRELARNPLMLSMITDAGREGVLSQTKGELFGHFTDQMLESAGKPGEKGKRVSLGFKKQILSSLACTMQSKSVVVCPSSRFFEIAEPLSNQLGFPPLEILNEILFNGILRLVGSDRVRCQFMHQAVQEYFAATALLECPQAEIVSMATGEGTLWHEPVIILCGLLPNPSKLIAEIAGRDIWFAAKCLFEGSEADDACKKAVVDQLVSALRSGNSVARSRAARLLGEVGHPRAIQPLLDTLTEDRTVVGKRAREALVNIGEPSVDVLIDALPDTQGGAHRNIVIALGEIGDERAIPVLIADLDADADTSKCATRSILRFGDRATQRLLTSLHHHKWEVRKQSAWMLGKISDPAAIKPLIRALGDDNSNVSHQAAKALMQFDEAAVEPLIAALSDNDKLIRRGAAKVFAGRPYARDVLALYELSMGVDTGLAHRASRILDSITASRKAYRKVVNSLIQTLVEADAELYPLIRQTLHDLPTRIRKAHGSRMGNGVTRQLEERGYPDLFVPVMNAVESGSSRTDRLAIEALHRIADVRTVGLLLVVVDDDNIDARLAATKLLETLGGTDSHKALVIDLGAQRQTVREQAVLALTAEGIPVVDLFIDLLNSSNEAARHAATRMLHRMGRAASEPLQSALANSNPTVCECAAFALGVIGDSQATQSLLMCLESNNVELRHNAIVALGNLGAQAAVPALKQMAKQDHEVSERGRGRISRTAERVLNKIQDRKSRKRKS